MTKEEIVFENSLEEYTTHFESIDIRVAAEETCPDCLQHLRYAGFKKDDSYRAFAYCPTVNCNFYFEF